MLLTSCFCFVLPQIPYNEGMNSITDIKARIITNSRGHDSIEVTVETSTGSGTFAVPEGASTGSNEVHTISAAEAVSAIDNSVTPHLRGMDIADQETLDAALHEIDDTGSFSKIGGQYSNWCECCVRESCRCSARH